MSSPINADGRTVDDMITAQNNPKLRKTRPKVKIGAGLESVERSMNTSRSPSDSDSNPRSPVTTDSDREGGSVSSTNPVTPGTPSAYIRLMFDTPDLTQPDDFTDVTLLVEEKKLYTCKGILASASPVWRRMFVSDFKEREAREIPLPGKKYDDFMELLLCISPAIQKPITGDNVYQVLPLADEYQMGKLKQDCEAWMLYLLEAVPTQEEALRYLSMAQNYNLDQLLERTVELASALAVEDLEHRPEYSSIERDTMVKILKKRVQTLERGTAKLNQSSESWRKKAEEFEDCLKKLSREKLTIKRTLDEISEAWEAKNSDARCIDPVHIYGPRHYNCEKCTKQVHTFIQAKANYLLNKGSTWSGITWPQ